ncbi:FAD:protein FMN transferase [Peptoniphilus rhinitidis]|uniref:FAD:protein FMN transferase n=1 Tax=Peptoniphilus rhinitidis TaxID=1175452 RepID=UPI00028A17C4|nr:FAD:protein FMN transferase [Peptoniphilus rhinitidis]MDU1044207.1 FAD:protein FMN transferase [Peptoniphilus rhinitidis]MDU2109581.1 FAD:protein FMN transferase [Peptoniphilus lacydonensis]MDU3751421.1 FAD:protein FMN transferase [Peptoniphilus rhinitidis]
MRKNFLIVIMCSILIFTGCNKNNNQKIKNGNNVNISSNNAKDSGSKVSGNIEKYDLEFYETFDTVVDVAIYSDDKDFAEKNLQYTKKRFEELHKLFDNYKNYDGITNVKTINDNAGIKGVVVGDVLFNLIKNSIDDNNIISHNTDVAIGPVTELWNSYRELYESGKTASEVKEIKGSTLPKNSELERLRALTNINNIKLDEEKKEVYLEKEGMKLDLGATAKGYATEIVARELEERGVTSGIISAGGNVRIIGSPGDGREFFSIGIQNPDLENENSILLTMKLKDTSAVTSGDYQRYFEVDGTRYCHIIDPDTLKPSRRLKSVTVINKDSGLCDFLSTAAFNSSNEEIESLAKKTNSAIIWVDENMKLNYTDSAKEYIKD